MNAAQMNNELSTLCTVLLSNLNEVVFFSKITGQIHDMTGEYKVQGYVTLNDGSTRLIAENGQAVNEMILAKGQGLSGYVSRIKRAYYSNSVRRDPIASTSKREDCVEAELCIPMIVDGSVIGTINVQSISKGRQFSESDIALVNDVLAAIAAPLRNMHMFLVAQNLNKELLARIESKEKELSTRIEVRHHIQEEECQLIGHSKKFLDVVALARKVAPQDFPVLLEGNHGVGKKQLARKIHQWSGRKGACVLANCSAFTEAQMDRELFGKNGLFAQANGGTLIIDEIGSLTLNIQSKILRALVAGEMITVDSDERMLLNVRLVVTSKVLLKSLVEAGTFKEDLYYRLNTVHAVIPSLRERQDDIKHLAEHFLNGKRGNGEAKILTTAALEKLCGYFWPGNAHELKNVMERTYILSEGQYIEADHLPEFAKEEVQEEVAQEVVVKFSEMTLFDLEKKHIIDTLDHLNGNKTRAAKALGITVKTLYNKLHSYGLIEARELQ